MKRKIAIVAGGYSSEWQVSMRSAQGIYSFLPQDRYDACVVTIIGQKWTALPSENEEYAIDKNDFSYVSTGHDGRYDIMQRFMQSVSAETGEGIP